RVRVLGQVPHRGERAGQVQHRPVPAGHDGGPGHLRQPHAPDQQRVLGVLGQQVLHSSGPALGHLSPHPPPAAVLWASAGGAPGRRSGQRPWKVASRRAAKAVRPSAASSVAKVMACISRSYLIAWSSGRLAEARRFAFAVSAAIGGRAAIVPASCWARASRSAAGSTSLTRPQPSACWASTASPVISITAALLDPTAWASSGDMPPPPTQPSLISGAANVAVSAARRMSQVRAASRPPPKAYPFTAATTGLRSSRSASQ